mmetsp:Transcript_92253/g.298368  ORF Transcript_92253/g.298368 Transcript_92253/m.298368 type:complete len:324 (-) Transcript_92253:930-1901(-)
MGVHSSSDFSNLKRISYRSIGAPLWYGTHHFNSIERTDVNSLSRAHGCTGRSAGIRTTSDVPLNGDHPAAVLALVRREYCSPAARISGNARRIDPPFTNSSSSSLVGSASNSCITLPATSSISNSKRMYGKPVVRAPFVLNLNIPMVLPFFDIKDSTSIAGGPSSVGASGSVALSHVMRLFTSPRPGPGMLDHSRAPPLLLKARATANTNWPGLKLLKVISVGITPVVASGSNFTREPSRKARRSGGGSSTSREQYLNSISLSGAPLLYGSSHLNVTDVRVRNSGTPCSGNILAGDIGCVMCGSLRQRVHPDMPALFTARATM